MYCKNQGWAIAHSLIRSFAHRSFPLFSKELLSDRSFCRSLQKSEWAIALFGALCKRANERSLFSALFAKEWMSDRSLFALFKRATKRAIALTLFRSFALSKRATKRAIALSLFQKERKSKNERSLIFKMSECKCGMYNVYSAVAPIKLNFCFGPVLLFKRMWAHLI